MIQPASLIQPTQEERDMLMEVWEWDEITGDPIPVPPPPINGAPGERGWRRHVPAERSYGGTFLGSPADMQFVQGMQNNDVDSFDVNIELSVDNNLSKTAQNTQRYNLRHGFLSMMVHCDFKKISVEARGKVYRVTKFNTDLIPWGGDNREEFVLVSYDGETNRMRRKEDIIDDINDNGIHGWMGPGTFWCRHHSCLVTGPLMTRSSEVRWGPTPDQVLHLFKRFTCHANDLVYMIHCDACLQMNIPDPNADPNIINDHIIWTNYIGETCYSEGSMHNFHHRIKNHTSIINNKWNRDVYPGNPADNQALQDSVNLLLADTDDGDDTDLLRDPAVHWNCIHVPSDRRYTILQANFESNTHNRKFAEMNWMFLLGNWEYSSYKGSLNIPQFPG